MYINSIFSFAPLSCIMNNRSLCGKCGGTLRYAGVKKYDGTMAAPKTPSAFWYGMYCTSFTSAGPTLIPSSLSHTHKLSMFVKENFSTVKSSERLKSHKDVMKKLAALFKESKLSIDDHT